MLVVGRREQQLGRVGGAARRDDDVRREALGLAVHLDDDRRDLVPRPVRLELDHARVRQQRHVRMLERRPHAEHLGVGLGVDQAGEAVARRAADAVAVGQVRLGQPDAARRVERVVAGRLEVVRELLDPRLVRDRGERVRRARGRLGRVLAARAADLVELLRQRVVRLDLLVLDRPGRRDAAGMLELAEVLLAEAVERRPVELGRPADEVVDLRLERRVLLVVPGVLGHVAVVDEDVVGGPVRRLAREPVAALEEEDLLAGGSQVPRERAAAGAGADDDDVVRVHQCASNCSGTMIRAAASISARCENACGKLPR